MLTSSFYIYAPCIRVYTHIHMGTQESQTHGTPLDFDLQWQMTVERRRIDWVAADVVVNPAFLTSSAILRLCCIDSQPTLLFIYCFYFH